MQNQKGSIGIIFLAFMVFVIVGGFIFYNYEGLFEPILNNSNNVVENSETDEYADRQTYINESLGFSLDFPDEWEDFVTVEHDTYVDFGFEAQDDLFKVVRLTLSEWEDLQNEIGPKPTYITENDKFVFAYWRAQDVVSDLRDEFILHNSIIETFKFSD